MNYRTIIANRLRPGDAVPIKIHGISVPHIIVSVQPAVEIVNGRPQPLKMPHSEIGTLAQAIELIYADGMVSHIHPAERVQIVV